MTSDSQRRSILRWTAPKNMFAVVIFTAVVVVLEYIAVSFAVSMGIKDPLGVSLSFLGITLSPLYFLVPLAVIITLTASFMHLTAKIASGTRKSEVQKKPRARRTIRGRVYLRPVRRFTGRIVRTISRIWHKILETRGIAYIERKVTSSRTTIRAAITITVTFVALLLLLTIAVYPRLVPSATADFFQSNPVILNLVTGTNTAFETIANAVPPLGALASVIHGALIAMAPPFRATLESATSHVSSGLVSLNPTTKFLMAQNIAAWLVASIAILYSYFVRIRFYRR